MGGDAAMIWQIVSRIGENDVFELSGRELGKTVHMVINGAGSKCAIQSNVRTVLRDAGIYPPAVALDLLHLAMTVYSADRRVRREEAYNRWERGFKVFLPVSDPALWESLGPAVERMLTFLTSDHWEMEFRKMEADSTDETVQCPDDGEGIHADVVALLSGGLDSFAGAVDLLESTAGPVAFVSHYPRGNVTHAVQRRVYSLLDERYPGRFSDLGFFVQPRKSITGKNEPSSRSRSVLFLSLGVAVASALGTHLNVFENGFMSLNVPLASNRIASLSTRTTHPHFLGMFQELLDGLTLDVRVESPYRFLTKGEMLAGTRNLEVLKGGIGLTLSCSTTRQRYRGISPYTHCGSCLPCIVRRAAIRRAGIADDTEYAVDVLRNPQGEDLRVLRTALRRTETLEGPLVLDVLKAGPLPNAQEQYVGVYQRGLLELKEFLGIP
jgi:7-cyano-7-deazaguanine synthase in queuosine biosynthesis